MRSAILACALAVSLGGEIVDRIAVAVGTQVVTESELLREIRLTAFLNGAKPDFSADSKRKAAERLIEQKLVRREMALEREPDPDPREGDQMLAQVERQQPPGEIERAGLTRAELREHLIWQAELLRFVDFRFRPAVQVADEAVVKYYQEHFANAPKKPDLADVREEIVQTLAEQGADRQMDAWLRYTRRHTRVEFHDEVFR